MTTPYFSLKYERRPDWWSFLCNNPETSLSITHGVLQRRLAIEKEQEQFEFDREHLPYENCMYGHYRYCCYCLHWVPRFYRVYVPHSEVDLLVSCAFNRAMHGKESCPFCLGRLDY